MAFSQASYTGNVNWSRGSTGQTAQNVVLPPPVQTVTAAPKSNVVAGSGSISSPTGGAAGIGMIPKGGAWNFDPINFHLDQVNP